MARERAQNFDASQRLLGLSYIATTNKMAMFTCNGTTCARA